MGKLRGWTKQLRALVSKDAVEGDLDEELAFHLEMETRKNLEAGMSEEEATRQARLAFGGVERFKEEVREARWVHLLEDLTSDLRYAIRRLMREPGFAVPVILILSLGIGVTTAMFTVVDATLLRSLPFTHNDRLVFLNGVEVQAMTSRGFPKSSPDLSDLDSLSEVFSRVAAYAPGGLNLTGAGEPMRAAVALVTPSFFSTLGVLPQLGRPFTTEEGTPENAQVAILSDRLWRRHFGADPHVIGRTIELNDVVHRVIGIMPQTFAFPEETEIWIPYPIPMYHWGSEVFESIRLPQVIARLDANITVEQASERLFALVSRYRQPERLARSTPPELVRPLRDVLVENRRSALLLLMGAATLMLLIACTNVANLILSRAARRRREIALRAALGASSRRILRQLLTESVLLALFGGILGIAVAYISVGVLRVLIPVGVAGIVSPKVDLRILLFTTAVALTSGLMTGLWPALQARTLNSEDVLRSGPGAGMTIRKARRLRAVFIVSEFGLTLVLLVATGIMLRSLQAVLTTDPGIKPDGVTTAELSLAGARYNSDPLRRQFYSDVLEHLEAIPDVDAAAIVSELPLRGKPDFAIQVSADGTAPGTADSPIFAPALRITPEYFITLGIPLLRGHSAAAAMDSAGPKEVVIDQELARQLWPGEYPIGKRLVVGGETRRTVVGLAANVHSQALDQNRIIPQMYVPLSDWPPSTAAIVVRGHTRSEILAAQLREAVRAVDPNQSIYNTLTMEQVIARTIAPRRTTSLLVALFGLLALALAAVGIYGVIAFGVVERRSEIGIRVALGARPHEVVRMVIREGLLLAAAGTIAGLAGAWFLSRMLEGLVFGVTTRDPLAFVAAPLILLGLAMLASFVPARAATQVDPLESLRAE